MTSYSRATFVSILHFLFKVPLFETPACKEIDSERRENRMLKVVAPMGDLAAVSSKSLVLPENMFTNCSSVFIYKNRPKNAI